MKLNEIIKTHNATVYGFAAFKGLEEMANKDGNEAVISTLSPAVMHGQGISQYYAPILPRGAVYTTTDEVIAADLDVQTVKVKSVEDIKADDAVIIVTRHQGTVDMLCNLYHNSTILTGNATQQDIEGKDVVGVLPPHLIQYCKRFKAVTIKDFDYTKDGDLSGDELMERLVIANSISVDIE